jgi:1-phosphofructokinase
LRAAPPPVTARSTVGAGDAMVAGIVAAQARGYDLETTTRLAPAFAVDAISRVGAGLGDAATLADPARRVALSAAMPALV